MSVTVIEERDQLADLTDMIGSCAGSVWRRFSQWAEKDDLIQEGWVWALENRAQVDEWLESNQPGLVAYWLKKAMTRYARKEKADRSGYSGEDEFFYSLPSLRRLLPIVLLSDGAQGSVVDDSVRVPTNRVSYTPHGEFEAIRGDLRTAFRALDQTDRELLWAFYVEEVPADALAAVEGVTKAVIDGRVRTALKRMQKKLGGSP